MERKIVEEKELLQENYRLKKELARIRSEVHRHPENPDLHLRILHDIEHSILALQDVQATAQVALRHVADLLPGYHSSSVLFIDQASKTASLLAIDFAGEIDIFWDAEFDPDQGIPINALSVNIGALDEGQPYQVQDLSEIAEQTDLQLRMQKAGIRSYISVPLAASGKLVGILNLASTTPGKFQTNLIQIMHEIADALAIAIQQELLRNAELQGLREAEVMRDIMAALASAGSLNQTLEIILVNLSNVIAYDRAAFYLLDDHQRYVPVENQYFNPDTGFRSHFDDDPLISEMRNNLSVLSIADIQDDPRFASWPDMESIRGWLGAPLTAGGEMIGFISLGSLEVDAYSEADSALVQGFTIQFSQVLEKAWRQEQSDRRTEELEVLSSLSFALDLEYSQEGTLSTIINEISKIFNAQCGTFIVPQKQETQLRILFSQNENLIGLTHQSAEDAIWQVYLNGEIVIIRDVEGYLKQNQAPIFNALLGGMESAALLPLHAGDSSFGVLCFTFKKMRGFTSEQINLLSTISEIAGASLQRTIELEALERKVNKRNQRLSTLYTINAVANEPIELESSIDQLLKIALDINRGTVGAVHLVDKYASHLKLVSQHGIPEEDLVHLERLDLDDDVWTGLLFSSQPLVIPDISSDERLPKQWQAVSIGNNHIFISAPIRAKGVPLGLMSIFRSSIQDYSVEDITLLMTVASQIGAAVERNSLINQAEQAAVVEERQRLARELHDSVTQLLYSQVLFATAGKKSLLQGDHEPAEEYLDRIDQTALQALREMRILVFELNPQDALSEGLITALERRLDAVERRTGLDARIEAAGMINLDKSSELNLYRLIQEALNNTLKHSNASSVRINIQQDRDTTSIEIMDNGCGFDLMEQESSGGMGLSSMQERAAELGAKMHIDTQLGQGTRISLTLRNFDE